MNKNEMMKLVKEAHLNNNQNVKTVLANLPTTAGALFLHIRSLCSNRKTNYSINIKVTTLADFIHRNEQQTKLMLKVLASNKLISLYHTPDPDIVYIQLNQSYLSRSDIKLNDFNNDLNRVAKIMKGDK